MRASWCLRILPEIQTTQIEHTHRFDTIDRRFDTIDAQPPGSCQYETRLGKDGKCSRRYIRCHSLLRSGQNAKTCRVARDKQARSHVGRDVLERRCTAYSGSAQMAQAKAASIPNERWLASSV
jgi:hypothetical protein